MEDGFDNVFCAIFPTGMSDRHWDTDMVLEQDRSGLMNYDVLDQRLTFSTVVTVAGAHTTVDTTRMFLSAAATVMYKNNIVFHLNCRLFYNA